MKPQTFVLLFVLLLSGCDQKQDAPQAPDGYTLGQRLIKTLPLAEDNTYKTPEESVEALADGLIENNWQKILAATSIRLRCERITFEAQATHARSWRVPDIGDPESPMAAFLAQSRLVGQLMVVQQQFMGQEPYIMQRLEDVNDAAEIAAAKARTFYSRPEGLRITKVEVDNEGSSRISDYLGKSPISKALGVEKSALVTLELEGVSSDERSLKTSFIVLKLGNNWLVDSVGDF